GFAESIEALLQVVAELFSLFRSQIFEGSGRTGDGGSIVVECVSRHVASAVPSAFDPGATDAVVASVKLVASVIELFARRGRTECEALDIDEILSAKLVHETSAEIFAVLVGVGPSHLQELIVS